MFTSAVTTAMSRMLHRARELGAVLQVDPPEPDDETLILSVVKAGETLFCMTIDPDGIGSPIKAGLGKGKRLVQFAKARDAFAYMGV